MLRSYKSVNGIGSGDLCLSLSLMQHGNLDVGNYIYLTDRSIYYYFFS